MKHQHSHSRRNENRKQCSPTGPNAEPIGKEEPRPQEAVRRTKGKGDLYISPTRIPEGGHSADCAEEQGSYRI
jgi:hypothetical protein